MIKQSNNALALTVKALSSLRLAKSASQPQKANS
jgi:hypothetical protein